MQTSAIKTMLFLLLLYCNVAMSAGTVHKCVDENGAVTFSEYCAPNQHAIDTGVVIDSRSDKQKAEDNANIQKHLENLNKQGQTTPTATAVPVAQPSPSGTPTNASDGDNNSYDCLSTDRNCLNNRGQNLTPAEKLKLLQKAKANQLPAKVKPR